MSTPADITDLGGGYAVRWEDQNIRILIEYLSKQQNGLIGEVTILAGDTTLCEYLRINLNSEPKTKSIAKKVHENDGRLSLPEWARLIESTCVLVLRRYRQGEPLHFLTVDTLVDPLTYQINPLVFRGKSTVLYGDGGLGKSSLALLIAMMVSTSESVAGISARAGKCVYLDYEDTHDVHVRGMKAIAAGHPALRKAEIRYQALCEPLWNVVHTLKRWVQQDDITFLVLDSLAAATAGDASAEAATKLFRAIRMLNVGALILAHIPKGLQEGQQEQSIYGSVFHKNFARSTWELKKEQDVGADVSILGLFNRKSNLSRLHVPLGLKVTQNQDNSVMTYEPFDLSQAPELEQSLPVASRIRNFLERDGGAYTAQDVSDGTGIKKRVVSTTLSGSEIQKQKMAHARAKSRRQMDRLEPSIVTVNALSPSMTIKTVNGQRKCRSLKRKRIDGYRQWRLSINVPPLIRGDLLTVKFLTRTKKKATG
jgi:hypothetical protein